jgi:Leucine-rich repeat (LRR) protein
MSLPPQTLINACAGKSRSSGGLNIPEFKQALIALFPQDVLEITRTTRRDDLHALCQTLSNRYGVSLSSLPSLGIQGNQSSQSRQQRPSRPVVLAGRSGRRVEATPVRQLSSVAILGQQPQHLSTSTSLASPSSSSSALASSSASTAISGVRERTSRIPKLQTKPKPKPQYTEEEIAELITLAGANQYVHGPSLELHSPRKWSLPKAIGALTNLSHLTLRNVEFGSLPSTLADLPTLTSLNIEESSIYGNFPTILTQLTGLRQLRLPSDYITALPATISNLSLLTNLNLRNNLLEDLPVTLTTLTNLQHLNLSFNADLGLPDSVFGLASLEDLYANVDNIGAISPKIRNLTRLKNLDLSSNFLDSLPNEIGYLPYLETLNLRNNQLTVLPDSMSQLTNLRLLRLGNNQINVFPEWIANLPRIEHVQILGNEIWKLPPQPRLLEILSLSDAGQLYIDLKEKLDKLAKIQQDRQVRTQHKPFLLKPTGQVIETTEWMEICKYLDNNYRINELREIARNLTIPTTIASKGSEIRLKSKRELCADLARSYQSFMEPTEKTMIKDRKCSNEPLIGDYDSYDFYDDDEIVEFREGNTKFCLSIEELSNIYGGSWPYLNPYNRQHLSDEVYQEYNRKKALPKKVAVIPEVHKTQQRGVGSIKQREKQDLYKQLETISSSYTYLPIDLIMNMKKPQILEFLDSVADQTNERNVTRVLRQEIQPMSEARSLTHIIRRLLSVTDPDNLGLLFDTFLSAEQIN